jgi:hypothetical protein
MATKALTADAGFPGLACVCFACYFVSVFGVTCLALFLPSFNSSQAADLRRSAVDPA